MDNTWVEIVLYVLCAIAVLCALWKIFVHVQGEAKFVFDSAARTTLNVTKGNVQGVEMSCKLPFSNQGKQFGALIDVFTRHYMPREQYDAVEIMTNCYRASDPRFEGYWDAKIFYVGTGDDLVLDFRFIAKNGDIVTALKDMPDLPVDIFYKGCSRSEYYYAREYFVITGAEINAALDAALHKEAETV